MNPQFLSKKSDAVNWDVCPAIQSAEPAIDAFFEAHGVSGVVTSAKDSNHSRYARHHQMQGDERPAQAIDLRTRHFTEIHTGESVCRRLVMYLNQKHKHGGFWVGVYHPGHNGHLHLEWNPEGVAPNIVSWNGKTLFFVSTR